MRLSILAISLLTYAASHGEAYFTANFANYIPSTFTLANVDGGVLQTSVYNNIGKDSEVAWVAGQLGNGYGRAALSPTRNADPTLPSYNLMALPPVHIADPAAIVRWEARSLHKHLPETYSVMVREAGSSDWTELYSCAGESHTFTLRHAPLGVYAGKDVEIAFIATTTAGFMLALDNIYIGVPDDEAYSYDSHTPHYIGIDDKGAVTGTLTCYGDLSAWHTLRLTASRDGQEYIQDADMPDLAIGQSIDLAYDIDAPMGQTCRYTLTAIGDGGERVIYSDFISRSYYARTQVIDRCSGTWCSNCPTMELTTTRLEELYGGQLIVIEAHVNDYLTDIDYWGGYLGAHTFAIPALIPNRDASQLVYSVKTTDDFSSALETETIATIDATATAQGAEVSINSASAFAMAIDNNADSYRVAYMLIGDIHDGANPKYLQHSQASTYRDEQYYYQPSVILPEMMYYDNVPLDASVACGGVPLSLPASIMSGHAYTHSFSLPMPERDDYSGLRLLAMLIDTSTGHILNACLTPVTDTGHSADITYGGDTPCIYYDLTGRRVEADTHGFVFGRQGTMTVKRYNTANHQ